MDEFFASFGNWPHDFGVGAPVTLIHIEEWNKFSASVRTDIPGELDRGMVLSAYFSV